METWMAETASAKAITELLRTTRDDNDFVCTREMWQAAIQVRDDLSGELGMTFNRAKTRSRKGTRHMDNLY